MTDFDDIFADAAEAVDEAFSEAIGIFPMRDLEADPGRPDLKIEAELRIGEIKEESLGGPNARGWKSRIAKGKAELTITRSSYAGPELVKDDKIRALDRPSKPWFLIDDVNRDHPTRIIIQLSETQ